MERSVTCKHCNGLFAVFCYVSLCFYSLRLALQCFPRACFVLLCFPLLRVASTYMLCSFGRKTSQRICSRRVEGMLNSMLQKVLIISQTCMTQTILFVCLALPCTDLPRVCIAGFRVDFSFALFASFCFVLTFTFVRVALL